MDYMQAASEYRQAVKDFEEARKSLTQAESTVEVMRQRENEADFRRTEAFRRLQEAAVGTT